MKYLLPYKNCMNDSVAVYREDLNGDKFYVIPIYTKYWNHSMNSGNLYNSKEEAMNNMDSILIEKGWVLLPEKLKLLL